MAYTKFVASSNTATNGSAIGADSERDVVVTKMIIGSPVSSANIWLYTITNPVNGATTNIGMKIALGSFSTTNINPGIYVLDFGDDGLLLNEGGNLLIDATVNVTILWHYLDEEDSQ